MSEWKKVKIDFATIKLGDYIEPIKTTVADTGDKNPIVYGVSNKDGISQTGKPASKDISNYIVLEKDCFAFNPYRINVGSIGVNDENLKGCVSPAYVVFKTKNGLLPKFLYFYLKSDYGIHLINWYGNRGGVRNALRYSDLCKIDIPDIRHLNQEQLLKTFSSAWMQIEELNKEIEKQKSYAKQLRQNILQEAIEGKLTADWRKQHPVQKGDPDYDAEALFEKIQQEQVLNKRQKTRSQKRVNTIVLNTPEGWKWVKLRQIIDVRDGTHDTPSYVSSGYPLITGKDFYYGFFKLDKTQYVSRKDYEIISKRSLVEVGDILFSMIGGNIGSMIQITAENFFEMAIKNVALFKNDKKGLVNQKWMYYFIKGNAKNFQNDARGGAQPFVSLNYLRDFACCLPPLAEQKEIVTRVEAKLQTIAQLETQIATRETTTKQLMQSILKTAFEE